MPVVDVSVLSATEVTGVSIKKSFCAYVRLQGQAIRTKPARANHMGQISFGERFRFQFQVDTHRPGRNRMFVELWTKSLFSQACVSVAWIEMAEQHFVRGQQMRMNIRGTFEGKCSTISLVVTPLDFGDVPVATQQPMQQQPMQQQQQPYPGPVGYPNVPGLMPYPMSPQAMYNNGPVEGVPLERPNPYTTAAYMPNATPVVQDPGTPSCHKCTAAPLPLPSEASFGASLPPPLYSGVSQNFERRDDEFFFSGVQSAADQNLVYDYGDNYPKKPKQL